MPSVDRDDSKDRELVRHTHSFSSDTSRLSIPMWDSSDPERAPPPLPLNPGSPSLTTRPNTSAMIANAAKALEEKARESMPASAYTTNPMPQRSPERSLIKGAQHKRMQSLQTTSVRDLRSFLDGVRSPERSPERPGTRSGTPSRETEKDYFSADQTPSRMGTPTPSGRDVFKDTPALRPSSRPLQKAILAENTPPPSATMLALQTMTVPREHLDPPLSNVTNSASKNPQTPPAFDSISSQLNSITSIVSSLQKDMTQLSRRSKDNATDLVSLKEATSSRDEDIRKSLKDLLVTMNQGSNGAPGDFSRSASSFGSKDPHATPTKQFTLPRIPSPNSFMMDDRIGSPNPYSVEGAASVAMLEKIIREMVTRDGQERLIANLEKLVDKATGETAKKVTELVEFVKQGSASHALVPANSSTSPGSGQLTRSGDANPGFPLQKISDGAKPYTSPKAADFVSEEMLKFLRKIKDSVAESGCMTAGTKAMIQDLRGEVLGMGRELARKIEEVEQSTQEPRAIDEAPAGENVAVIVQEELANLKQHMDQVMRERRRQSMSSTITRNTVDNQEVYEVVKHALAERGYDDAQAQGAAIDKEAILSAVREAYEAYRPNIEIEQFGLEKDEILQCLREGLQDYQGSGAVSREEIEHTIQDAMRQITLPPPINEAHEIREEVLMAVRECLEDFKPSLAPQELQFDDMLRRSIIDTIRECFATDRPDPCIEIPEEVIYAAVKEGVVASRPEIQAHGDPVVQHFQTLVEDMRVEFKNYSAANGRDTEQVLDALKDGLESMRSEIETYVDRAQDVTHKDEIVDSICSELERLRIDVQGYVAEGPRGENSWSQGDMVAFIKSELEHLHEQVASKFLPALDHKDEILAAINAKFEGLTSQVAVRGLDLDTNEEINEAMKQEFEQLKAAILGDTVSHKDELLDKMQSGFDDVHARLDNETAVSGSSNDILTTIKEEFEHLRETLGGSLVRSGSADKDDIIDAVRELFDGLRTQLPAAQSDAGDLATVQSEIEQLRESLATTVVRASESPDKDEILEVLKSAVDDMKAASGSGPVNEELLEALRGELEQIRQSDGLTRQHTRADTEEVLEAVRLGLDDLRTHIEKKLDNPDQHRPATNEIIDSFNEGLEGLRTDVLKSIDKPVDMTVSYEILDTLKEGIVGLREDINKLKGKGSSADAEEEGTPTGNEVVLAEDPDAVSSREIIGDGEVAGDTLKRNDLEKMEVMLAQLQIKVEAMDANIQNPATSPVTEAAPIETAVKENLVGIEDLLKQLQESVQQIQETHATPPAAEGLARKEDTDAIETLLGNVKAKLEELPLPEAGTMVTKENLDEVELVVRTSSEAIDALSKKITEEGATKGDVAVVQVIVDDIKIALDEMKASKSEEEEPAEKANKADIDALSELVCDIKAKFDEMKLPDPEELPSKADLEQLTGLIHDFRESHDKLVESYEGDIFKTASNFDDRKKEAEALTTEISDVKIVLDDIKEEIKATLTEGGAMEGLKESFKSLEDSIGTNSINADVKELMETVSREFERAHGSIEGLQNSQEEKSALALEKHDEAKEAIITGLVEKVDDRFNTLMTKYDDAQLLADEQAKVMKEKAEEQEKILESTKAMADELRLTIDTLGTSITSLNDRFEESTQKLATDSATVFGKIDDTIAKMEEQKLEEKTEHSHTRDEIANVERIFNGLQDNITEYHPKFMVTLREIEALVKQHYEHSQKSRETADEQVRTLNEEAKARAEELTRHFSNLPALLPAPPAAIEPAEKFDDTHLQEKLDRLIGHANDEEKAAAQLERLDEIHKQVMTTANEVNELVAKQTQAITDGNEAKEREAEEIALLIERRKVQKEQLDADIESLKTEKERVMQELKEERDRAIADLKQEKERTIVEVKEEKDSLLAVVAALQVERENLANQKVRLTGEVSSLHTALEIRREELHMMDAKADALERRILNGIMDHSRALMMAKGVPKAPSKLKKRMSADASTDASKLMPPPTTAASGLSMALKPRPAIRRNGPPVNPASRRIHSLSQISGNTPTGAQAYQVPGATMSKNNNLKRSHSVKNNYVRKGSWGGRPHAVVANKENDSLNEEDEIQAENVTVPMPVVEKDTPVIEETEIDDGSEAGTERRHSFVSGSYDESYVEGETPGYDGRSSFGGTGSEYTYASGSYMTGSDIDRRTSYGSTAARSTLHGEADTIDDRSDDEHSEASHDSSDEEDKEGEDEDPTETLPPTTQTKDFAHPDLNPSEVTASDVTASEVSASEVTASEVSTNLPTQSEVDAAVEAVREELKKEDLRSYAPPSDSGVGTDLATAQLEELNGDGDYFRRQAEEESTVG